VYCHRRVECVIRVGGLVGPYREVMHLHCYQVLSSCVELLGERLGHWGSEGRGLLGDGTGLPCSPCRLGRKWERCVLRPMGPCHWLVTRGIEVTRTSRCRASMQVWLPLSTEQLDCRACNVTTVMALAWIPESEVLVVGGLFDGVGTEVITPGEASSSSSLSSTSTDHMTSQRNDLVPYAAPLQIVHRLRYRAPAHTAGEDGRTTSYRSRTGLTVWHCGVVPTHTCQTSTMTELILIIFSPTRRPGSVGRGSGSAVVPGGWREPVRQRRGAAGTRHRHGPRGRTRRGPLRGRILHASRQVSRW
jgi:hypothetical protein